MSTWSRADPNLRGRGIGRALYERAFDDAGERGGRPDDGRHLAGEPGSIAFHRAVGFRVDDGPGTTPLYGTPAHVDHDGDGEDRVVFTRSISETGTTDRAERCRSATDPV